MELLKTSHFINSIYEDDITYIDYLQEGQLLFNTFSFDKKLKMDLSTLNDFLCKTEILFKKDFFKTFKKPLVEEYFCQQLNFLLLIDFISRK
jgi:hypothetical protein